MKANLSGKLRSLNLPAWQALLPLCEAIMNSIHAIEDRNPSGAGKIEVTVIREPTLLNDISPISGFQITDNGVGFIDENYDSFNTLYSDHRMPRGGKGLGRTTWLKAFDQVQIDTVFEEKPDSYWRRSFRFTESWDPDRGVAVQTDASEPGTTIRLMDMKKVYRTALPASVDLLCERLVEHFLLTFLTDGGPSIEIRDAEKVYDLQRIFRDEFQPGSSVHAFTVRDHQFTLHGFKLTRTKYSRHRLCYAADKRSVQTEPLDKFLPNLSGRLTDEDTLPFYYLGVIKSDYLSAHVNHSRTAFDLDEEVPEEVEAQLQLEASSIKLSEIREAALRAVQEDLGDILKSVTSALRDRVEEFVSREAPQYRVLLSELDQLVKALPPTPTKMEIDHTLHRELYEREQKLRTQSNRIRSISKDNPDDYRNELNKFMSQYDALDASNLARYVWHRRYMLDALKKSISLNSDDRYPLEEAVHDLIFRRRKTSNQLSFEEHNLWIIDERLSYHRSLISDIALSKAEGLENGSLKRPDILVQHHIYASGRDPIGSISIIEFKRPGRDGYAVDDHPLMQVRRIVSEIRQGNYRLPNGRLIPAKADSVRIYCYIVCDISDSGREVLDLANAVPSPDGNGYYGYNSPGSFYYEVVDYDHLISEAERRNRAFFERLGIGPKDD